MYCDRWLDGRFVLGSFLVNPETNWEGLSWPHLSWPDGFLFFLSSVQPLIRILGNRVLCLRLELRELEQGGPLGFPLYLTCE